MDNVVVTGASRGLGLAIAERLVREGFRIVAVARRDSEALAAAAKLAERGSGAVIFRPLDLSDVAAIPAFVRNCAGNSARSTASSTTPGSARQGCSPPCLTLRSTALFN